MLIYIYPIVTYTTSSSVLQHVFFQLQSFIYIKIYYPPPCERLVWDYSKADLANIRKSLSQFNWHNALKDLNANKQVEYLSSCILNVFSNFVPNKNYM